MIAQLVPFLTASIILTISPGPDIIYVLVQSIANGRKAGIMTTIGLVSGILIHTSLVAFGVSAIIKESESFFLAIRIFGAVYLFYLAFKVYSAESRISLSNRALPEKSNLSLFKTGFIMNVLNPKVTIFFLAFFPGFLWDTGEDTVLQFYTLGGLFMLQALLIFGMVAMLAGRISGYLNSHSASGRILKWLQIFVFLGIGLFILF
ncbi:LysE family translocator [Antarcticibacterium flavum]|uniref:LysE family translocator n=1 Tax=Antarcticibacterium flavum TaxID=2058175 RepID=A0A5B7X5T1_9FLAO|nr:LysE family translocator [Antarcticibacterium flavum]MCM4159972.1 lysine transporter LysE [Antarcticibacterium sp. W02-3]QCY70435.1 LysE family translocator [Antarcticibacterium flavum]